MIPLILIFFVFINFYDAQAFERLFDQTQQTKNEEQSYTTTLPQSSSNELNVESQINTQTSLDKGSMSSSSNNIENLSTVANTQNTLPAETYDDVQSKKIYSSAIVEAQNAGIIDNNTEFYCKTKKEKQILLRADHSNITYMFGKNLKQPDIVLTKPWNEVSIEYGSYSGGGTTILTLSNGSYEYVLEFGKIRDEQGLSFNQDIGSVSVFNKGKQLATVECDNYEDIYQKENSIFH